MGEILEKMKKIFKEFSSKITQINRDKKVLRMKELIIKRKLGLTLSFTAIVVASLLFLGAYQSGLGYKVIFNGQEIGVVKRQQDFQQLLEGMKEEITLARGDEVLFQQEVAFEKIRIEKEDITSEDHLQKALSQSVELKKAGAIIKIGGKEVVAVENKNIAEDILEEIKKPYTNTKENVELKEVSFVEKVEIVEKDIPLGKISPKEEATQYLEQGTDEVEIYQVALGDTTWDISRAFDVGIREIEESNPDVNIDDLHPGDEINLTVPKPFISIKSVQVMTTTEQTPFETIYKEDKKLEKGKQKVITEGKYGAKEVTAEIVFKNGIEETKTILSEKVIKEPTDKVVAKGTKAKPSTARTGQFSRPASGRTGAGGLFGVARSGGRRHAGIDIANSTGTPIYAADGGSVTSFIGYRGGYGYIVEVNHGAGYTTRYAHLSKILVSSGQRVSKGQQIAKMGNTGNSTGPHLHFEIRKNGTPQNPFNYISR